MTSRETKTHCVGSYSSHKGSFKNPILIPNELSSLCKDVRLESLAVQSTYKLVFDVDAGYVHFAYWTAQLTVYSKGTYSQDEILHRFTLTLHKVARVHPMNCWIHALNNYFLNDLKHGRLIHVEECGMQVNETVLHCVITGIVQMRSNLQGSEACHLLVHIPVDDKLSCWK